MIVSHKFADSPDRKIGMLLPLSEMKHMDLMKCSVGDVISDPDGNTARIVAMTEIYANSIVADCLAKQLYGRTIETVRKKMEKNWPLYDDTLLYLVIELI